MAVMIPSVVHKGSRSPGERDLFFRLRDDPATAGWVVLHSLDIAYHDTQRSGEVDFVVIVPGRGVLCLEVKSHRRVRRQDGLWFFGSSTTAEAGGPFKQAAESMHSLRRRVGRRDPSLSGLVFWSAVAFTSADFRVQSEEWRDWQVIDSASLRSRPISALVSEILDRARALLEDTPSAAWFDSRRNEPTAAQCTRLIQLLRPDFEAFESPRARARGREAELLHYTADQFAALDTMVHNPRVVFEGPAGTGKTLLALEAARRARADGRRVLLLCYNRLLGSWLESETQSLRPEVDAGTLHRYMMGLAQDAPEGSDAPASYWEQDLPAQAIDRLLEDDSLGRFDEVILDEAQDLLRELYLDVIDLTLRGGLAGGRWRFFGDFERQAIYGSPTVPFHQLLEKRTGTVTRCSLRTNCRNTPRIVEMVYALGALHPPYQRVLRPDDGIEPTIRYYAHPEDQTVFLEQALEELEHEGFRGSDVVILSPRAHTACAERVSATWKNRLRPLGSDTKHHTQYCSIHSFKGLEAPAIIVTDVKCVTGPDMSALFYVATTRSLHRLVILAEQPVRDEIQTLVRNHLLPA